MKDDQFYMFWGGPFSQWAKFDIEIDGMTFNCCEQYMMYQKALLFEDHVVADQIMATKNPKEQKKLGRKVKNFDKNKWEEIAREVVYESNYAKFSQNALPRKELAFTNNSTIVEASPYDSIWGIGMSADDPRASDPQEWQGLNWLGEAIMRARDILREEGKLENES